MTPTAPDPEPPLRILHLEDSLPDHQLVRRALTQAGLSFQMSRVESLADFTKAVREGSHDLILADYVLPGFTALDAWDVLQAEPTRIPFVLLSGAIGEAAAVAAIHHGISDFLHKENVEGIGRVVRRALQVHQAELEKERADEELAASEKRLAGFAEHLQTAIEQERAAIAREIHDDIGGSLAAARLDLAWVTRHASDPAVVSHIQTATEMLQHAISASQRIMMNLRPSILDQGLVPAIQWMVESFERRTGIPSSLKVNNEQISASKSIELTAYRTTQEALTNILKHANCTRVRVDVSDAEGVLTLEISDNGKGMAIEETQKHGSFGLKGLRERAKTVQGWVDISSQPGKGTSIILSIPLPGDVSSAESEISP